MLAVVGAMAMEERVGGVAVGTVSVAVPLTPLRDAVIVVDPDATPVATPAALTVATVVAELLQAAVEVTLAVEPSL
jgi:hypothetical protein